MTRRLVAGNWKMHGLAAELAVVEQVAEGVGDLDVDVALCLPATLIERAARLGLSLPIGAQDVHAEPKGAHTGCISAAMLIDAGARLTIVGHSERREGQGETDADVRAKATAAQAAGLGVILCVGESLAIRDAGEAIESVSAQLDASLPESAGALAVAYEPIWAIGTGRIPSLEDIGAMHAALRGRLTAAYGDVGRKVRLLYGGSVKASNAADIFAVADVDGALVGGASLSADDFVPICRAAVA